jgi:hypothetical protein
MRPLLVAAVSSATIMLAVGPQANARAKGEIGEVQSCLDSGKTALKERLKYCTWNYADLPEINYSGDNRGAAVEYAIKRRDRLAGCILSGIRGRTIPEALWRRCKTAAVTAFPKTQIGS